MSTENKEENGPQVEEQQKAEWNGPTVSRLVASIFRTIAVEENDVSKNITFNLLFRSNASARNLHKTEILMLAAFSKKWIETTMDKSLPKSYMLSAQLTSLHHPALLHARMLLLSLTAPRMVCFSMTSS